MLHNGNQTVGTDGRVNLYSNGVLSSAPELLDFKMLLEPLEEQLYLPTILVEVGNLQCGQFCGIGQEHKLSLLLLVIESHEPQILRIAFLTAIDGQFYLDISQYPLGKSAFPLDALVLQIVLGSDNKE